MMRWCGTCRRRSELDDTSTETEVTAAGEVSWRVEWLLCGHTIQSRGEYVGPAEGAPYAGPQLVMAYADPYPA